MDRFLTHVGYEPLSFADRTHRVVWVDRFQLPVGIDDPGAALGLLVGDEAYRRTYAVVRELDKPVPAHGPYRIEAITRDSFEPVSEAEALAIISDFIDIPDLEPGETVERIRDKVEALIAEHPVRYRLGDLGKETEHETGWILNRFRELVVIDPTANSLILLVAAVV